MKKFLFVYHGGSMAESPEEIEKVMAAWGAWFESMGAAVVDGGAPVSMSSTVNNDGTVSDNGGSNPASGYSLIQAASMGEALALAKGCPIRQNGGNIEVAEAMEM